MADGAYRWQGHAPEPDAARVDAIRAGYDEARAESFGEPARAALAEGVGHALAAGADDRAAAAARLTEARSVLEGLRPEALEPRRGLAGLFDSRKRRLARFREGFGSAAASLADMAADLSERIGAAARRSAALDAAWAQVRDALVEVDAHLAAARRLTSGHAAADAPPHPLRAREAALEACRAAALAALPLIRAAQNADARAAGALTACTEGVATWRDGWRDALGLAGKRPRKVRPDRDRLLALRADLFGRIDRAGHELTASGARRAAVEARLTDLRAPV